MAASSFYCTLNIAYRINCPRVAGVEGAGGGGGGGGGPKPGARGRPGRGVVPWGGHDREGGGWGKGVGSGGPGSMKKKKNWASCSNASVVKPH